MKTTYTMIDLEESSLECLGLPEGYITAEDINGVYTMPLDMLQYNLDDLLGCSPLTEEEAEAMNYRKLAHMTEQDIESLMEAEKQMEQMIADMEAAEAYWASVGDGAAAEAAAEAAGGGY